MESMEEIVILFFIFAVTMFLIGKWNGVHKTGRRNPPSLPSLPLVGSLPFLRNFNNIPMFFMEKSKQLGPIFTFRAGNKLVLTLNTKEVIEEAFLKHSRAFSSRPEIYVFKTVNPNRQGMVLRDTNEEFKQMRQRVISILKEFGFGVKNIMEERILAEIDAMIKFIEKKNGEPFETERLSVLFTSNIIINILFGRRQDYEFGLMDLIEEINIWSSNVDMIFDFAPFVRFIPYYRNVLFVLKQSYDNLERMLNRESAMSLRNKENECFVSRYVAKEGTGYNSESVMHLLRDLIAGGTDTTSVTFQWMLIALANNPEIQKRLQEEIDSVVTRNRQPSLEDQSKLPYVEQ